MMGSRGSLHFKNTDTEKIVRALVEAYADEKNKLNREVTHNNWGKPFILISKTFVSVYDGSFASYGDMNSEGKLLSQCVGQPVLGFNNINDDMMCLSVYAGQEEVTGATFAEGEWWDTIDLAALMDTMQLEYTAEDWEPVFSEELEQSDEMLEAFEKLTGQTYIAAQSEVAGRWPCAKLVQETEEITVFVIA